MHRLQNLRVGAVRDEISTKKSFSNFHAKLRGNAEN